MTTFLDRYDLFVFDLDGTLADTREDLADSVNETLRRLGRAPLDIQTVTMYVGDGVRRLIERSLGEAPTEAVVVRAMDSFLGIYGERCTRKTSLYPGVREVLLGLSEKSLAVLTNKPLAFTRKILAFLAIDRYFRIVEGGDSAPERKPGPGGLTHIARSLECPLRRTLLVGDSSTDILTARAAGADSAFVAYGFRPDAWRETPPDHRLRGLLDLLGPIHGGSGSSSPAAGSTSQAEPSTGSP